MLAKIGGVSTVVSGLIGLIASAVALVFVFKPNLSPDPGTIRSATMKVESVEPHVSYGRYLVRYRPSQGGDDVKQLSSVGKATLGEIVYVLVQVEGEKHDNLTLGHVDYYWTSKRAFSNGSAVADDRHHPDTPNDQWVAPIWVPTPRSDKDYFVRLMLFDKNVMLAFADTGRLAAGTATSR